MPSMAHRWHVRLRGNVPVPFNEAVSWWTDDERRSDLRRRVERRIGESAGVAWSEGETGADRWLEARWSVPSRALESLWRLVRHPPAIDTGPPSQARLTASLTTEGSSPRGRRRATSSRIETVLIDRDQSTEVRLEHSWTSLGSSIWQQLLTRRALAAVAKADFVDLMLRCEADMRERDPGRSASA